MNELDLLTLLLRRLNPIGTAYADSNFKAPSNVPDWFDKESAPFLRPGQPQSRPTFTDRRPADPPVITDIPGGTNGIVPPGVRPLPPFRPMPQPATVAQPQPQRPPNDVSNVYEQPNGGLTLPPQQTTPEHPHVPGSYLAQMDAVTQPEAPPLRQEWYEPQIPQAPQPESDYAADTVIPTPGRSRPQITLAAYSPQKSDESTRQLNLQELARLSGGDAYVPNYQGYVAANNYFDPWTMLMEKLA